MTSTDSSQDTDFWNTDDGFTLVETMVSVFVISVVMAALSAFFVSSASLTNQQGATQAATQLAADATSKAHNMKGSDLADGRDAMSSHTQWNNPVTGVAPYLVDMAEAWDATAAVGAGATAVLPTSAKTTLVNTVSYQTNWYLGKCWQPLGGGDCIKTQTVGYATFYRVVVAVTWRSRTCASSTCNFVTSTLVSNEAHEPMFNINTVTVASLTIVNPGNQTGNVGTAVNLQLLSTFGVAPLTWTFSGLPPGLTGSTSGLITGTLPAAADEYTVLVTVKDSTNVYDHSNFTWSVVTPLPANATGLTYSRPCTAIPAGGPTIRAVSTASGAASSTFVDVSTPATQPGDVLLAFLLSTSSAEPMTPVASGWNAANLKDNTGTVGPQVTSDASNSGALYWRIAAPSQPATYRFSWPHNTASGTVVLASYSGVDPSDPLGEVLVVEQTPGTGITGSSLAIDGNPSRYVLATMMTSTLPATANGIMSTADAALSSRATVAATNTAGRITLWDKQYTSIGSTGSPAVTWAAPNKPALSFAMVLRRTTSTVDPTVYLSWTASADTSVTGYTVLRSTTSTTNLVGRATASWPDTTTAVNAAYPYTLKSVNGGGSSTGVSVSVPACP